MRLLAAHVTDFVHSVVLRHWPYWTCRWVMEFWPGDSTFPHECAFCRWAWPEEFEAAPPTPEEE